MDSLLMQHKILLQTVKTEKGYRQHKNFYGPIKSLSFLVLTGVAAPIFYAFFISVLYWAGIGV